MKKSSFEQNGGPYRMVGDYRIPNIVLPAEANEPLSVGTETQILSDAPKTSTV